MSSNVKDLVQPCLGPALITDLRMCLIPHNSEFRGLILQVPQGTDVLRRSYEELCRILAAWPWARTILWLTDQNFWEPAMENRDITQFLEILAQRLLTAAVLQEFKHQTTVFWRKKLTSEVQLPEERESQTPATLHLKQMSGLLCMVVWAMQCSTPRPQTHCSYVNSTPWSCVLFNLHSHPQWSWQTLTN